MANLANLCQFDILKLVTPETSPEINTERMSNKNTSINISLPENMKDFITGILASAEYVSASEYVRELIREDQEKRKEDKLDRLMRMKRLGEFGRPAPK
jgi:putative addiction module CopG family antidote